MKNTLKPLWVALLCMPSMICFAQLRDDFSDGDYTQNPVWTSANPPDWIIHADGQLQSNLTIPNSYSWISASNLLADSVQWELDVQLRFNPSSANYLDIYLICSDSMPVSSTAVGYFVRLGNTEDEIALYRKDAGNKIIRIIDGVNGLLNQSDNRYRIKVTRRQKSLWTLWYDAGMTGNEYIKGGSTIDSTFQTSRFFSLFIQQSTASFFQKHFVDNISVLPFQPDKIPPSVISASIQTSQRLVVQFSEAVDDTIVMLPTNYSINNGIGQPKFIEKDVIKANSYILSLDIPLVSGNQYALQLNNIRDTEGNQIGDTTISLFYYTPEPGDIIINELLFNPKSNGSDYIEILNRSPYPVNMKGFSFDQLSTAGQVINSKILFTEDYEMNPGTYIVFTTDKQHVLTNYDVASPSQIREISSLPALPDDKGNIRLLDAGGRVSDELSYDDDWHFPLLNQKEGVALERIDPYGRTQDEQNWNSASQTSGYGTPTAPNSQRRIKKETRPMITLSSPVFSPDQDGYDDVLFIQYEFPEGGFVLNCIVFDIAGRPVRTLQRNRLCGVSGSFKWDGLDEQNNVLPMGHYILFTEVFNLKGEVKRFRQEFVLARRR